MRSSPQSPCCSLSIELLESPPSACTHAAYSWDLVSYLQRKQSILFDFFQILCPFETNPYTCAMRNSFIPNPPLFYREMHLSLNFPLCVALRYNTQIFIVACSLSVPKYFLISIVLFSSLYVFKLPKVILLTLYSQFKT